MKNLVVTEEVLAGKVYMVEMQGGDTNSFRVLGETPTHFIFSFSNGETEEVFEKAKTEVIGVYDIKEWLNSHPES